MIALVVPYREQPEQDRAAQLRAFVAHMRSFLRGARFLIVVAEQSQDGRKFNRGQLLSNGAAAVVRRKQLELISAQAPKDVLVECLERQAFLPAWFACAATAAVDVSIPLGVVLGA